MVVMMAGAKQFKTYEQQLVLLERRGMVINDSAAALQFLHDVSY